MFTKLTRSGGHTYVQLVESFRDETGRPRQRTISTLGRLDEVGGQVDSLLKVDFTRIRRHISTSSSKLLECQRAQLV